MHFARTAAPGDAGLRLDLFWGRELKDEGLSRERIKQWIREGLALVEGRPCLDPRHRLAGGERLELRGRAQPEALTPDAGHLDILYRDEHLAVLAKPAGLTTHPAPGLDDATLVHRLLHHFPELKDAEGLRPGIVHRLDKDTSGLMVVALTEKARLGLAASFAERSVSKAYLALVHGSPRADAGSIDAAIGRHPVHKTRMAVLEKGGKPARSDWRVVWRAPRGRASLVMVRIHTGRTHQVRVHMAHMGHPLLGDAVYGGQAQARWKRLPGLLPGLAARQMLHAFRLSFAHPESGRRLSFWQAPPADFVALMRRLDGRVLRVALVGAPGSGKSSLLHLLEHQGFAVFSADACVARLYAPGGEGSALLARRFGSPLATVKGGVDKPALFAAMREKDALRREVADLVHPLVWHAVERFFAEHEDAPFAVAEIPLLLECGHAHRFDVVVGVACPEASRTGLFRERRLLAPEDLAVLDSWQWPAEAKLKACDLVVENSGSLDDLAREAGRLAGDLLRRAEGRDRDFALWLDALWPQLASEQGGGVEGENP